MEPYDPFSIPLITWCAGRFAAARVTFGFLRDLCNDRKEIFLLEGLGIRMEK
jgi:hypothetical protein